MRFLTYASGILIVLLALASPAFAQNGEFFSTDGLKYLALAIGNLWRCNGSE